MKHFSKSENKTRKISGGVNIADSNRQMCLNDKGNVLLTEEEIREYFQLVECEKVLDQELSSLKNQRTEFRTIQEIMDLLHRYNDIKDVTQVVLGAIAVANRTTVKSLYRRYSLSLDED
ncbi:DNA repair protein SWI5 homolog [Anthophora plagiata]